MVMAPLTLNHFMSR